MLNDEIEKYYDLGFSFVKIREGTRAPMMKGWQKEPRATLETALGWAKNKVIGLRTGLQSGVVVVDVDTYKGAKSDGLDLPDTVTAITGRGGLHYYYRCKVPVRNSNGKISYGIDIKGDGGQVIYPGSIHDITRDLYRWKKSPAEIDFAELPDWVIDSQVKEKKTNQIIIKNSNGNIERCIKYLCKLDDSISGNNGDQVLNRAACEIIRFDLSDIDSVVAIEWFNNNKCDPPWSHQKLLYKLNQAREQVPACEIGCHYDNKKITFGADLMKHKTKPVVLVPGGYVDDDENYIEQTEDNFIKQSIDGIPPLTVFCRGEHPVIINGEAGSRRLKVLTKSSVRSIMTKNVNFKFWKQKKGGNVIVHRPLGVDLSSYILDELTRSDKIKSIKMFTNYPVLKPDYTLCTKGYNDSGVFYDEPKILENIQPIKNKTVIRDMMHDITVDFPFDDDASLHNFIGLLLTPIVKPAVGTTPLFMTMASLPRTGKSMLIEQVFGLTIAGQYLVTQALQKDEAEKEKRFYAMLKKGKTIWYFDNFKGFLDSASIAMILTARFYEGRNLGKSEMEEMPIDSTFVVTANNPSMSQELVKRTIPIKLTPANDSPESRTDFVHPDIAGYVRDNRRKIMACLIGMISNWRDDGKPLHRVAMGGFNKWAGVVGGILDVAGFTAFRKNEAEWRNDSDTETNETRSLVDQWWFLYQGQSVAASDIVAIAEELDILSYYISSNTERGKVTAMGRFLSKNLGSPIRDYQIVRESDSRKTKYKLKNIVQN